MTEFDIYLLIACYMLFGMLGYILVAMRTQDYLDVADLVISLVTSVFWPLILLMYVIHLIEDCSSKVIWKRKVN